MTDENSASSVTPNADPQGETPNTSGSGETPETTPTTVEAALKELESYKKALAKANAESKDHRLKAKELDDLKTRLENEKLSEQERLQKQLADAQSSHDGLLEQLVDREVRLQAAELGVSPKNLKHVSKLIWDDLEFDTDTGMPTNVEPLLKDLLKELDLTGDTKRASSGGATNPSRSASSANPNLSWGIISKMTPEQYSQRQAEIQAWMQKNPPKRF